MRNSMVTIDTTNEDEAEKEDNQEAEVTQATTEMAAVETCEATMEEKGDTREKIILIEQGVDTAFLLALVTVTITAVVTEAEVQVTLKAKKKFPAATRVEVIAVTVEMGVEVNAI